MRFDEDTTLRPTADGAYELEVSDRWGIYGNPNGGYLAALMGTALGHTLPHDDPFTVTCHYLKPTRPGPATVQVETLRAGRGVSTGLARLVVDGRPTVHASAMFGDFDSRRGATIEEGGPPDMPGPEDCDRREGGPGGDSTFGDSVELRFAPGTIPFVDGRLEGPMELGGWMRFRDGRPPDARSLLLFADAMPPPTLRVVPRGWVPTLELTVHVRRRPRPGWIGAWFRTRYLIDGYLEEDGELFDEDGRLVAVSRQLARVQTQ